MNQMKANQSKMGMKYKKNRGDMVKELCANYDTKTGHCMILDKACPLVPFQYRNHVIKPDKDTECDYFNTSVLGLDISIKKESKAKGKVIYSQKDCCICGKGFKPSNSRNKYCCDSCKESATKRKYRRYNSHRCL
jgi:hypothetical protein